MIRLTRAKKRKQNKHALAMSMINSAVKSAIVPVSARSTRMTLAISKDAKTVGRVVAGKE